MIEELLPYTDYRESGLAWLKTIPRHWLTARNGILFQQRNDTRFPNLPILEVSLRTGVRIREFSSSKRKQVMADASKYKRACAGDVAYNMMRMWQGAVGVAPVDGLVSPAYVVARPFPGTQSRYYTALFKCELYMGEIDAASRGIVKDRNRLYWDQFKQMQSLAPPPDEQVAIVKFLDHANGKIERAIRAKRKLIGLLNEQKQAIIHRAVTRGLDPNVKLKPSCIPWLGDVPEHWETPLNQRIFKENIRAHNDQPEIPLSLSQRSGLIATANMQERSLKTSTYANWKVTVPGDLVVNRFKAHLGVFFSATLRGIVSFHYGVFSPRRKLCAKYFELLYHTAPFCAIYAGHSNGMTVGLQNLSNQNFYNVRTIVPPIDEQLAIVEHLQTETADLMQTIDRIQREIDLLREYRTTLTAEVVTGKLDVRGAAKLLPDEAVEILPPDDSMDELIEDEIDEDVDA